MGCLSIDTGKAVTWAAVRCHTPCRSAVTRIGGCTRGLSVHREKKGGEKRGEMGCLSMPSSLHVSSQGGCHSSIQANLPTGVVRYYY